MKMTKLDLSFCLAFILTIFFVMSICLMSLKSKSANYVRIQLVEGDTLWGLSKQYKNYHNYSESQFVKWVIAENNLKESIIISGKELIIPVKKSEWNQKNLY